MAEGEGMEKKNRVKGIVIAITCVLSLVLIAYTATIINQTRVASKKAQVKEKAIENGTKDGYHLEFIDMEYTEDEVFCIEEGGVKYYYSILESGVTFYECKFLVVEEGVEVKEGELTISIADRRDGNLDVGYRDHRAIVLEDGTEKRHYNSGGFVSNTDFDKDSRVINNFVIDAELKSIQGYETIMKYSSVEELKGYYQKALLICDKLNA